MKKTIEQRVDKIERYLTMLGKSEFEVREASRNKNGTIKIGKIIRKGENRFTSFK